MEEIKSYLANYSDKTGRVLYDSTFQAKNLKNAKLQASIYKKFRIPYQGSVHLKTTVCLSMAVRFKECS